MKIDRGNARAAHIEESEARILRGLVKDKCSYARHLTAHPNVLDCTSESPPVPHESMTRFWGKLDQEAKNCTERLDWLVLLCKNCGAEVMSNEI